MRKIKLGNSGLTVSQLSLGTVNFGTVVPREQCTEQIDRYLEMGGNFIDTAHVYNDWVPGEKSRSEKIVGEWIAVHNREDIVLSTKGGHFDLANPSVSRVTRKQVRCDIEESLEYLKTDYIDLYFLHRDNTALPAGEIVEFMNELIREKKVKAIGCSNWSLARMREANDYAKSHGQEGFSVNQLMWSLARINKTGIPDDYVTMDADTYRYHKKNGLAAMCYSSQAKGYFAKRAAGAALPADLQAVYQNSINDRICDRLQALSAQTGRSVTELSLQYFVQQDFPAVPIVSCSTTGQLKECAAAFEGADTMPDFGIKEEFS